MTKLGYEKKLAIEGVNTTSEPIAEAVLKAFQEADKHMGQPFDVDKDSDEKLLWEVALENMQTVAASGGAMSGPVHQVIVPSFARQRLPPQPTHQLFPAGPLPPCSLHARPFLEILQSLSPGLYFSRRSRNRQRSSTSSY